MFRRAFIVMAIAGLAVGGLAPSANANIDQTTCTLVADTLTSTSAKICVDVDGSYRRVYIHGSSLFGPTLLTVHFAYLLENSTVVVDDCCGWSGYSDYYGTPWPVQFGHTYTACASFAVRDPILGARDFGYNCSLSRAN